jgi:hypothetical protein
VARSCARNAPRYGNLMPSCSTWTEPMLLERMAGGELKTAHLAAHPMPLDEGAPRI